MLTFEPTTFVFQIINFFVLLFVFSRFFYGPLTRMMQAREEEIAAKIREADERVRQAEEERARLAQEAVVARATQEAEVARVTADSARERATTLARAREEAAKLVAQAQERGQEETRAARARVETEMMQTALAVAARVIVAAAGPRIHEALLEALLTDSASLSPDQRVLLRLALVTAHGRALVELAYPAPTDLESRLKAALAADLADSTNRIEIETRVEPALLAGARIVIGTVAIDLSLRHTLDELGDEPLLADRTPATV